MRIGRYTFRPGLVPTLVTLLLLPAMIWLGFWQLDRAAEKRELHGSIEQGRHAPALNLNAARPIYANSRNREATASGEYDGQRQFLIDNQMRQGRAGYLVLTPLRLEGAEEAVLVAREWLPAPAQRSQLPEVALGDPAPVTVRGRIDRGPSVGLRLGPPGEGDERWPARIQYVDFDYLQERVPYPLLPYMLRLDEQGAPAPSTGMTPEKHVGYAVQWFAMALALLAIYLAVNLKRTEEAQP